MATNIGNNTKKNFGVFPRLQVSIHLHSKFFTRKCIHQVQNEDVLLYLFIKISYFIKECLNSGKLKNYSRSIYMAFKVVNNLKRNFYLWDKIKFLPSFWYHWLKFQHDYHNLTLHSKVSFYSVTEEKWKLHWNHLHMTEFKVPCLHRKERIYNALIILFTFFSN